MALIIVARCLVIFSFALIVETREELPCNTNWEPIDPAFQIEMEWVEYDVIRKTSIKVIYDAPGKRVTFSLDDETFILDYGLNVATYYTTNKSDCYISTIRESIWVHERIFPTVESLFPALVPLNDTQLFEAQGLLGARGLNLLGYFDHETTASGVPYDEWVYCFNYSGTMKNVFVYWSAPGWNMPGSLPSSPLGFSIKESDKNGDISQFDTIVTFYSPTQLQQSDFQIPNGIFCQSIDDIKIPIIPPGLSQDMHFDFEGVKPNKKELTWGNFHYDSVSDLSRMELIELVNKDAFATDVTATADLNKNIVYVANSAINDIVVRPLVNGSIVKLPDDDFPELFIGNPADIFWPTSVQWTYSGEGIYRSLNTVSWQAKRSHLSLNDASTNETLWQWSFSNWTERMSGDAVNPERQQRIPIYLNVKGLTAADVSVDQGYSIVNFESQTVDSADPDEFDISAYFRQPYAVHLQFELIGFSTDVASSLATINNRETLRELRLALAATADISVLRIAKLRGVKIEDKLFIQFYLLGIHPNTPFDLRIHLISLEKARSNLANGFFNPISSLGTVKPGSLIEVTNECDWPEISPTTNAEIRSTTTTIDNLETSASTISTSSTSQQSYQDSISSAGIRSGEVAGAAIGAFLLGLVSGAGGTFIIRKNIYQRIWN